MTFVLAAVACSPGAMSVCHLAASLVTDLDAGSCAISVRCCRINRSYMLSTCYLSGCGCLWHNPAAGSDSSVGQVLVGGWPSITLACLPSQPSWRLETLLTFVVASDTYTFTRLGHSLRRCKNPQAREVRLFTRSPNHNKPYIHL